MLCQLNKGCAMVGILQTVASISAPHPASGKQKPNLRWSAYFLCKHLVGCRVELRWGTCRQCLHACLERIRARGCGVQGCSWQYGCFDIQLLSSWILPLPSCCSDSSAYWSRVRIG